MNHSTPGLPVHHQLLESTQTHVHWVGDAIQPSHPLSSPSPPALNLSQHQGLFKWVSSSHQVAKVLDFQLQNQSYQWTPRTDLPQEGLVGKKAKRLSEEALQIAEKRREAKGKGEKERYTHLKAEFQRIGRRDKKGFLSDHAKKQRNTGEWERLEIASRKLEIPREHVMQRWAQ